MQRRKHRPRSGQPVETSRAADATDRPHGAGHRGHRAPRAHPYRPAARASEPAGRSSIVRMFEILDLFSIETPTLQVEDIAARLRFTRSMAYRYVKELSDAGLVAPVGRGSYALGPRILELERQLHLSDPLLQAGLPVMRDLSETEPDSVFLLCSLYRDRVLCIHHEGPEEVAGKGKRIPIRRVRGLPFPLFVGAASLAILAHLPPHQIRSLFLRYSTDIAGAGLGEDWDAFRSRLAGMRRAEYVATSAQMNADLVAVAVPVIVPNEEQVLGSLTHVAALNGWTPAREAGTAATLKAAARAIGKALDSRAR
jgi:DNA-binding IclR family transcriptional regulator